MSFSEESQKLQSQTMSSDYKEELKFPVDF